MILFQGTPSIERQLVNVSSLLYGPYIVDSSCKSLLTLLTHFRLIYLQGPFYLQVSDFSSFCQSECL